MFQTSAPRRATDGIHHAPQDWNQNGPHGRGLLWGVLLVVAAWGVFQRTFNSGGTGRWCRLLKVLKPRGL
ncbi:MAG: hypothetical protein R3B90_10600 [Planctomycetaceae bacterium]